MKQIYRKYLMMSGVILLGLILTISTGMAQVSPTPEDKMKNIVDDIKPYEGSIGPGSALYGLKIAIENMGETFTFNETEKVKKQVEHAELRLAEAKAELKKNNIDAANRAIERYREKIQAADDRVTGIRRQEPELLDAQERIVKHQLVLQQLLEAHPGNRGLETALNNSQRLEVRFENKTRIRLEHEVSNDRLRITIRERREGEIEREVEREVEHGAEKEEIKIKAIITDNRAQVRVKGKFITSSTDHNVTAKEVLDKLKAINISELLEVQAEKQKELQEKLEVEAKARGNVTEVKAEFRFPVNSTDRTVILDRINQKLAALKLDERLTGIDIKQEDRQQDRQVERKEDRFVQAEVIGNAAEVQVRVEFVTPNMDRNAVAQEILNKLKLQQPEVRNLLEMQRENELEVEAKDRAGVHEAELDLRFQLATKDKNQIIDGIRQKVSSVTERQVRDALDVRQEDRRGEGQERHEAEAERGGAGEAERGGEAGSGGGGGGSSGGGK